MNPLLTLLPGTPTWSDEDGAAVRALLMTPPGQHLMRRLLWARPEVAGTDPEARRIRSDERAGYEACIQEILNLATPAS